MEGGIGRWWTTCMLKVHVLICCLGSQADLWVWQIMKGGLQGFHCVLFSMYRVVAEFCDV